MDKNSLLCTSFTNAETTKRKYIIKIMYPDNTVLMVEKVDLQNILDRVNSATEVMSVPTINVEKQK